MPESPAGLLLVAGVTGAALAVALVVPRWAGRRAGRSPIDLAGIDGRVVFFSAASCRRCDVVRVRLSDTGARFTEVRFEDDPGRFEAAGVRAVPIVVGRDEHGTEVMRLAGRASSAQVRALVERCGVV